MQPSSAGATGSDLPQRETLFGHPVGLYTLFFAEMWERFSYYGMRALLVLYLGKGFLQYNDADAYAVYGAYTALVYMTPFFGGMLADRILGTRSAVVFGGLLMAAGHLAMMIQTAWGFYTALALIITGNGFFKPNISTIVGTLYPEGSPRRDGGFTIFYMGVNLGAALAPLLCGYLGENYGWEYGFGLATIGMLAGLAAFVVPAIVAQSLIVVSALAAAIALCIFHPSGTIPTMTNIFVAICLVVAAIVSAMALQRGGLPRAAGAPPERSDGSQPSTSPWIVYGVTLLFVPLFVMLVSGFSMFRKDQHPWQMISDETIQRFSQGNTAWQQIAAVVVKEVSRPAGLTLFVSGLIAAIYLVWETVRLPKIARERMQVVLILTFFSMLFWAFFEQAGSSLNNFADRNVDRVVNESRRITQDDVGKILTIEPTQEQLGYTNGDQPFTLTALDELRKNHVGSAPIQLQWTVSEDDIGMGLASRDDEIPASTFQAVNPVCILVFGLVLTTLWGYLGARGLEPSTPFKFALGLLQVGIGFGAFWYGAQHADVRGMTLMTWLVVGYLLHTTGELCLSPVGLSMITKLSPKHLVATAMGTWFLATAFSQFLAAIIAQFTGVSEGGEGQSVPIPSATVAIYGKVFGQIAVTAVISAVICFALVPVLKRWMHREVVE